MPASSHPYSPRAATLQWSAAATIALSLLSLLLGGTGGAWGFVAAGFAIAGFAALVLLFRLQAKLQLELEHAGLRQQRDEGRIRELRGKVERLSKFEPPTRVAPVQLPQPPRATAHSQMLSTLSHELRTPLNGIVPMLDMLIDSDNLSMAQREFVGIARTASQQLLRLIDDIRDESRLEDGRIVLETTSFDLSELLDGSLGQMRQAARARALSLDLQIDPEVRRTMRGDPGRLRQVLLNLIGNAIKYTDHGGISVGVRRLASTEARHLLRFEITDTGIGIPLSEQERVFDPYHRVITSTERNPGGTGLGLSISRRIIELMGGRIGVESEPRRGSTFWFEIPLLKSHGDRPLQPTHQQAVRLLLVTADTGLDDRMAVMLPEWGIRTTTVSNVPDALARLRASAPQGPGSYGIVMIDMDTARDAAASLVDWADQLPQRERPRVVCLQGNVRAPESWQRDAVLISRNAPDAPLRAALFDSVFDLDAAPVAAPRPTFATAPMPESAPAAPPAPAPEPRAAAPVTATSGQLPEVLLVDDDPVNLKVGQSLLATIGIDCDIAENGAQALQKMGSAHYDIVLMDCRMPIMDGYETTHRWRHSEAAIGGGRRLPIIAMTANAMPGDRERCLEAGMNDYLAKPITRDTLVQCLNRWLPPGTSLAPPIPDAPAEEAAPERDGLSAQASQVVCPEVIRDLSLTLGDELTDIIDRYLEQSAGLVAELEKASMTSDHAAIQDAARDLRLASTTFGALPLAAAASELEQQAKAGQLRRPVVAVAQLAKEFTRVRLALRAIRTDYA